MEAPGNRWIQRTFLLGRDLLSPHPSPRRMLRQIPTYLFFALGMTNAQQPPFRVQTKIVQVPVSVTNQSGGSVDGLSARDFTVLDNGIRQEDLRVDDFSTGLAP